MSKLGTLVSSDCGGRKQTKVHDNTNTYLINFISFHSFCIPPMGRFLNYLNSAPLNLCVEGTQALILETLGEQWNAWWITGIYLIGELFCYLWNLQEHQQIIFTLGYLLNKYYSVSLLYTHGKTFALYAGTYSHLSFVPFFFIEKIPNLIYPVQCS